MMDLSSQNILLLFAAGFIVTFLCLPIVMRKMREKNIVGRDAHKTEHPLVPEMGGIGIIVGLLVCTILGVFLFPDKLSMFMSFITTVIIAGIIAFTMIVSMAYYAISPHIRNINKLGFIGFDFITLIKNFSFNFHLLDLNYMLIVVAGVMLTASMIILKKSHTNTKERVFKYGVYPLIAYVFFYFLLLGAMWVGIAFDVVFRRKQQKW